MDNAILNKLMNLLISLARDVVVPPLIGEGGGGGGGWQDSMQVACEAHIQGGKVLGHPHRGLIIQVHIFSVGSHCQGIVTFYIPSTLSCLCNSSCALVFLYTC